MWKTFLENEGIFCAAELKIEDLRVWNEAKLSRIRERLGRVESAVLFLIPYFSGQKTTNLSVYAQPRDYHGFVRSLSLRFSQFLEERGEGELLFAIAADSSPIDERDAALRACLGFLGDNGLVMNRRYGSYFFIGEIFLSRAIRPQVPAEPTFCTHCGACRRACPTGAVEDEKRERCLSLISQKKNLTPEEETLLAAATCKWGCDECQTVCPFNQNAEETRIPYFREGLVSSLSPEVIEAEKEEFLTRAFSWRGREILRRNLKQ